MPEITFHFLPPEQIDPSLMEAIIALVMAGGLIDTARVRRNLGQAFLMGFALSGDEVVGTCALKRPRKEYLAGLMERSGLKLSGYLERGYTSVAPQVRGQGVGQALVDGLTQRSQGRPIYVVIAEDNHVAQKMSVKAGAQKAAVFPAQAGGKAMAVWIQGAGKEGH